MFSCEICEIFKNIYFEEHQRITAASAEITAKAHSEPTQTSKMELFVKVFNW